MKGYSQRWETEGGDHPKRWELPLSRQAGPRKGIRTFGAPFLIPAESDRCKIYFATGSWAFLRSRFSWSSAAAALSQSEVAAFSLAGAAALPASALLRSGFALCRGRRLPPGASRSPLWPG